MKTISRVFLPVIVVTALLFSTSCLDCIEGDGNVIQKTIEVGNFTKIKLNGDANITLTSDTAAIFLIKGEKNILDSFFSCGNFVPSLTSPWLAGRWKPNGTGICITAGENRPN